MPNPKDKEGRNSLQAQRCKQCDRLLHFGSCEHFPGCHKVHIECANKLIDSAVPFILALRKHFEINGVETAHEDKWLESLGAEE